MVSGSWKKVAVVPLMILSSCAWSDNDRNKPLPPKEDTLSMSEQVQRVVALFPTTPQEIRQIAQLAQSEVQAALEKLIALSADERTFENSARALDDILRSFERKSVLVEIVGYVHPDKTMRDAAHEGAKKLNEFSIDAFGNNVELYLAFKEYAESAALKESLNDEQRYFIDETMQGFKRSGLHLSEEKRKELAVLKKKLSEVSQEFDRAIAEDNRAITVTREDLAGLDEDMINALKKTDDGLYILGVDYPTYFGVMENCTVAATRKKLWTAFSNRACPENIARLEEVIALRDHIARMLGYESFAAYDTEDQMIKNPQRARDFLNNLIAKAAGKERKEFELLTAQLPEGVALTANGKLQQWDGRFIKAQFKKKHLAVDEEAIAQYFPMQKTIDGLLDVYTAFMGVQFKQVPVAGTWHDAVKLIEVFQNDELLGYLFLDLYPREGKYSHACHCTIVPAQLHNGVRTPGVSVVIANFPQPTAGRPALLKRSEVNTFFHEFGHAVHALFGATELASFAGTNVKRDFVEMPSQMLEEWLWDKEILQKISSHYETGEPLPDTLIDSILNLKNFDTGHFVQRQAFLATFALNCFDCGAEKNSTDLLHQNLSAICPHVEPHHDNNFHGSFGHLIGYGAKYYGYLWSKVFALDLFAHIKKHGLLNPEIGKKYVQTVLARGGSKDPNELLVEFLGREPSDQAFFDDLGL